MKKILIKLIFVNIFLFTLSIINAQTHYVPTRTISTYDFVTNYDNIYVANGSYTYTVLSGGISVMEARQSIVINPGFTVNPGAIYYGTIAGSKSALIEDEISFLRQQFIDDKEVDYTSQEYLYNIYPNPTNGLFYIELSSDLKLNDDIYISIFNNIGSNIYYEKIISSTFKLDISNQPPGMYFIKIAIGENIYNEKIIKK